MNNTFPQLLKKPVVLLFLIANLLFGISDAYSQTTYPVQTNVYLAPPYSNFLSDYYSTSKEKLVVTLLSRDQQKPTLDVRLRVTVTAVNGLKIQSREEINYPTITLDAGIPFRLTQDDLAPYFLPKNINTQGSLNQGKLPEGLIEFTFQAIEKYTGKVLSAPATGRVWLTSQKPPILRIPSNNEHIAFKDPLNLKFQWEPLHKNLSQVEYLFELKELPNNGAAPQSAFAYSPLIYQERLVYTYLMYNVMMPPLDPDKRYAWRVKAIAKDGVDDLNMFDNNGYSEVFCFNTISSCDAPTNCMAKLKDRSLTLSWTAPEKANEYVVQYRLKYDANANWEEGNTYETQQTLYSLQRGATYEFRVGSICTSGQPVFSEAGEISIPKVDSTRLARCGIPGEFNLDNREPIENLKPGDVVMVNDYPMTLTRVSGGNGSFSGEGWVPVNWLLETKWQVEFDNIQVNTDKRMTGGSVRAKYDESQSQIASIDEITKGGHENTREGIILPDFELNVTIPENPVFDYNPDTGEMTVFTTDGQEVATINVNKNDGKSAFPMTIKDEQGNIYQIEEAKNEDGSPKTDDKGQPVLTSTCLGQQGNALANGSYNPKVLSENTATVRFEKGSGFYALDNWRTEYKEIPIIRKEYDKLGDAYYASWKYLPEGGSDKVLAVVEIAKNNPAGIVADNIFFSTPQGVRFDAKPLGNDTYEITLAAGKDKDVLEILALHPKKEVTSQFHTLGKLNVVTYQKQENRLGVVQAGNTTVNGYSLEEQLNEIYNPVGVHWKVEVQNFDYSGSVDGFFDKESGLWKSYNDKMNALIAGYKANKQIDSKASYIFLLKNSGGTGRDVAGFMPRGKQFGFVFTDHVSIRELNTVIAHELGHGRWRLTHTFDDYGDRMKKSTTDNLMDYANGTHLAKWQWEQLNDPAWFTNPFEGDEKSKYKPWAVVTGDIIENIPEHENEVKSFITLAGEVITLPSTARDFTFYEGYLVAFTIENERWVSMSTLSSNKYFVGFYKDAVQSETSFDIAGKTPYKMSGTTQVVYFAKKEDSNKCSSVDIYKVTLKSEIQSNNGGINKEDICTGTTKQQITELPIIGSIDKIATVSDYINCLEGRAKEFYKFVIEHYTSNNIVLTDEFKTELAIHLGFFESVFINQLDGDSKELDKTYKVDFKEMFNYGHLNLLEKVKEKAVSSIIQKGVLVITMEDSERMKDAFLLYKTLKKELDSDCVVAEQVVQRIIDANKVSDLLDWEFLMAVAKSNYEIIFGNEAVELLSCLLKNLRIPDSFWNPNRLDNETNILLNFLFEKAGINPESFVATIPLEFYSYQTACGCGAWNSVVDLFLGVTTLVDGATTNPIDIYKFITETINNLGASGALSSIGTEFWDVLKEHHGYIEGYGVDSYQASYGVCYDAIFVLSFYIGLGEIKALAAAGDLSEVARVLANVIKTMPSTTANAVKAVGVTLKNMPVKVLNAFKSSPELILTLSEISTLSTQRLIIKIAEVVPENTLRFLSKDAKIFIIDAALGGEIAEFSGRGLQLINPFGGGTGQISHLLYESSEAVTDIVSGKTGILKIGKNANGGVVAVIDDVAKARVLKKITLGSDDMSQFAIQFRKTLSAPSHRGNIAVFEYMDNNGKLVKKAFTTEIGSAMHSEEIAIDFFNSHNIPKQNIKRIYSELEPCSLEEHMCKSQLQSNYPNAEIKYSYDYPGGNNASQEIINIRRNSVNVRANELDKLLKQ